MAFELLPQEFVSALGSTIIRLSARPETFILLIGFALSAVSGLAYEVLLHSYMQRMKQKKHFNEIVSRYFMIVVLVHVFTSAYFVIRMLQSLSPIMPDYLTADMLMIAVMVFVVITGTNNLAIIKSFADKG